VTLAALKIGITIISIGRCTFPVNVMTKYHPTGIVGRVFKLLRLARRMRSERSDPQTSSVKRLVAGGESFADESRALLEEVLGVPVYNAYGSTEGTMSSQCRKKVGLHVPGIVHLDVYDLPRGTLLGTPNVGG
jgi:phenylacetate-coenzyme A ligase PaaK-like adenylate-forming protein